ncbi:DUF6531 domain-containing protein [Kitasatospora sp. NBC_01287]|uniref:putative T7SS-secreted protein n=1 Tax=Kitasatospora sp. NBC_01287 TaxID=2903573 RepID=UPI002255E975|nr:DUF6531 domain-containing protein [Kitasatospora sp. NBC_01287]MCX4750555.1 DUF6531 domain-containing protein [Kitasatospora sp. NBC_01287]
MGFLDDVGDGLEGLYKDGKKQVGRVIDQNAHTVGGMLDFVGLHDAAHAVDHWGDGVADSLGAQIGEMQLGDSDDPKDLVHGDAKALIKSAGDLRKFHDAFQETGGGLQSMDSDHWKGQAADAFRTRFAPHPGQWLSAADACATAAQELEHFAETVAWAQDQAKQAIDAYNAAKKAHQQAQDAYNTSVDAYNKAAKAWNTAAAKPNAAPGPKPTDPGAFQDPSTTGLTHARDLLRAARAGRDSAADQAAKALRTALAGAPAEPSFTQRMKLDAVDLYEGSSLGTAHLLGGVVKGGADIVKFGRALDPMDAYNVTHPATYLDHLNQTAAGLVHADLHPVDVVKSLVGSGWSSDPFEAGGKLFTNIALGVATDGAGEAATATETTGIDVTENAATNAAKDTGDSAARDAAQDPAKAAKEPKDVTECGDPVDVATGHMFLHQRDTTLRSSLPLAFERTHRSDYRAGVWMGPTWSCTLDERLVVDAERVLLLRADGVVLSYPPPAPGAPTLPTAGVRWTLSRQSSGTYTVYDPRSGLLRTFTPDQDREQRAPLTEIRDRNGHWIAFDYDFDGVPTGIRHSAGYHLKVSTTAGRISALHLVVGDVLEADVDEVELLRYGYTDGHLTEVINSSGVPQRFEYDASGRMTAWLDRNGSRYEYKYDDLDRCINQGGIEGHLRYRYVYSDADTETGLGATSATDSLGQTSRYLINSIAQVVAEIDPMGGITRYARDRYGRLLALTDPTGRTTSFEYDEHGNLVTSTRPDGRKTMTEFDTQLHLPTVSIDFGGRMWRQEYDQAGNRNAAVDPSGAVTRYSYDSRGHLASVTDPLGRTTSIRCDAAGLPVEVTDPRGGRTRYSRDAFGRPVIITDPVDGVTELSWTVEGRLARRTDATGATESWTYDGEGNMTRHTDAMGAVTTCEYGPFDRLTARTGANGARYLFEHDTELRLVGVTNPEGLQWRYSYDSRGFLDAETDFNGRNLAYLRDEAGRLVTRLNGLGERIDYEYDLLGAISSKSVQGMVTTFEHDELGHLTRAVGPNSELIRRYDRCGRILEETCDGRTLTFDRDVVGRRITRRTPSGAISRWTYDANGGTTQLESPGAVMYFDRDLAGRETGRAIGNRLLLTSVWDPAHRLLDQTLSATPNETATLPQLAVDHPLPHRSYRYQLDGQLLQVDDRQHGTRRFTLDALGRVAAVHADNWSESYAYDLSGRPTAASWPASPAAKSALGERLYQGTLVRRAGMLRYEYDAQGRVTLRQRVNLSRKPDNWHYTWDAEDRLVAVTTPDGQNWRYLYDPLGRRTSKQLLGPGGTTAVEQTDFTWDSSTLVEQSSLTPGLPGPHVITWDHDRGRPVAQTESVAGNDAAQVNADRRFFAIVTDLIGTPVELVDDNGRSAWRSRANIWGATTWPKDSRTYTPLRFPGQYYDPESRLHYNLNRYYDPEAARYLSPDPAGLRPAPDNHSYVSHPLVASDPLGLAPCRAEQKRKALRDAGVADDAVPLDEDWVPSTNRQGKQILDENHQPVYFHQEYYETKDGDIIVFQDHYTGHSFGAPDGVGDQPPHLHVRPLDDPRNGVLPPPAEAHYYYDPSLG